MGWRNQLSGRGPFNYLPPQQRPGRLYGRGACWQLNYHSHYTTIPLLPNTTLPKEQEIAILENQAKLVEQTLEQIRKRLEILRE